METATIAEKLRKPKLDKEAITTLLKEFVACGVSSRPTASCSDQFFVLLAIKTIEVATDNHQIYFRGI
jgi:hypothetical protein